MAGPPTTPPAKTSPNLSSWLLLGAAALVLGLLLVFLLGGRGRGPQLQADATAPDETAQQAATPSADEPSRPSRASVAGQVRSTDGEAIADALVTLVRLDGENGEDGAEPQTTRSDADGSWSLAGLDAGVYAASATAPGFLAAVVPSLKLAAGRELEGVELRLAPGGVTLSGTVADKTGGVVEGALIRVTPQSGFLRLRERDSYFTQSDEQGHYALQVPSERARVQASHPDYTAEAVVLEIGTADRSHDFALIPTAVLEGVVVRESDGSPVAEAEVVWARERNMMMPDGGSVSIVERGGRVRADADGRFRISGLPPGLVVLTARASMLASADPLQVPVGIAERVTDIELRVAAASDVEGRVIAVGDGQGIADAQVEVMSRGGPGATTQTDADGHFRVLGVLPGEYGIMASAEGWMQPDGPPTRVTVGGQPASVVLELERGRMIRGRVEPALAAEVAIELEPESMQMGGGTFMLSGLGSAQSIAETGVFEIGPVEPGHYTLEARAIDGRGGTVEVEVGPDGAEDVVISLEQRAILAGRVEDFTGKLLDDVSVRARKRNPGRSLSVVLNGQELTALSSPTSTEGRFEIAGLAAGDWTIDVVDAQGDPLALDVGPRLELELAAAEQRELVLRVEPRDGTIRGVVRDADSQPVTDAWVSAAFVPDKAPERAEPDEPGAHAEVRMVMITDDGSGTPRTLPPVLTDEQGRFAFTKLRRGEYTLTAELDGGTHKARLDGVRPDADVTLELAPLGSIEGTVTINGESIDCLARIIGPTQRNARVRDGKFEVERLDPGRYTIEASTAGGAGSQSVEVEAGATASVALVLERLSEIKGKIIDESGQPLAGVEILIGAGEGGRVEISREDGDPQIFTAEDGSFVAHAAAGGRVLLAQQPGTPMPIVIHPFAVSPGQDVDLGELRKKELKGMMMMGGPGDEADPGE